MIRDGLPAKQPSSLDASVRRSLDRNCELVPAPLELEGLADGDLGIPRLPSEESSSPSGEELERCDHTDERVTHLVTLATPGFLVRNFFWSHPGSMNPNWPLQGRFVEEVKAFAAREGLLSRNGAVLYEPLAARMNTTFSYLRQLCVNKSRKEPSSSMLRGFAEVMGIDPVVLLSVPKPPEISESQWRDLGNDRKIEISLLIQNARDLDIENIKELSRLARLLKK